MITLRCPDCGMEFRFAMVHLYRMAESYKRNPNLRIICTQCGAGHLRVTKVVPVGN